jgi:hypothetical protein
VKDATWPRTDIDRFILARLEAAGLSPASQADPRVLIRRLYFDLTGLPPTVEEVEQWSSRFSVSEDSLKAELPHLVDQLLASRRFGERWARHWLDLVRYAETRGHEFDYDVPGAWRYRDYVIRAFNEDVSYKQFVTEHLAGDLLAEPRLNKDTGFNESILGTGFWFLGEWVHSPVDIRQDEAERFDNMTDVMTKTFLGLTVGCARCHDHKFDAITQKDYYALQGFLQSSEYRLYRFDSDDHNRRIAEELHQLEAQSAPAISKALVETWRPTLDKLPAMLLAAREVLQIDGAVSALSANSFDPDKLDEPLAAAIERVALTHGLNPRTVALWSAQVACAKESPDDPLRAWAVLALTRGDLSAQRVRELLAPLAQRERELEARAKKSLDGAKVVVDYTSGDGGERFIQDGVSFRPPIQPGQIMLGDDADQTVAEVADYGSVRRDPAFIGLRLAPDAQRDAGRLGEWERAGKTFRTPNFTIESPLLFHLVKGPGRAYVAVDSHRMVNGPLHGQLVSSWPDDGRDEPRWIAQDLRLYQGHRAHVEFSPEGDKPLEVLMVVQSATPPGKPWATAVGGLAGLDIDSADSPPNLQAVADSLAAKLQAAARRLGGDGELRREDGIDYPRLADWLVKHGELLSTDAAETAKTKVALAAGAYQERRRELCQKIKLESRVAPAMWDGYGEDEVLFIRGNYKTPGDLVERRFLDALDPRPISKEATEFSTATPGPNGNSEFRIPNSEFLPGSGRLELALRMTDPAVNPFITRVIVNRVWQHLFGQGIVASVDNFGVLGQPPTHPELLDHLAARFSRPVADDGFGWSVKRLIREIVLSRAYQMASEHSAKADEQDPQNKLLHRMNIRRLEAEAIRDAILAVSGRLDDKPFGTSVPVYLTPFMQGRGRPGASGPLDGAGRRSIYIAVRRNFLSPLMLAFDAPQPFTTVGARNVSNVPAQALILLNDPFVVEQAGEWARRVLADASLGSMDARISHLYEAIFSRPPSDQELADARAFLAEQAGQLGLPAEHAASDARVWADLCHVLFNVKEFVYVR